MKSRKFHVVAITKLPSLFFSANSHNSEQNTSDLAENWTTLYMNNIVKCRIVIQLFFGSYQIFQPIFYRNTRKFYI